MKNIKKLLKHEVIRIPLGCLGALGSGYLLSVGTVCGVASPLAAAFAGIVSPLYAICILFGSLLAYSMQSTPAGMTFLLTSLVSVSCVRLLFYEARRPHVLAALTIFAGCAAGFVTDLYLASEAGFLPLYIMEALLTGVASYFLADAMTALQSTGKLCLDAGKSFTFAIACLLVITALCGLDLPFCNIGRIAGIVLTLLAAKQFGQQGGTLMGALTACGTVLCSMQTGMPLLFLPVTAMLSGFLRKLPNALFIPLFFLMQGLSSAILDSSAEFARVLVELLLSCCLYALCSHAPLYRILTFHSESSSGGQCVVQREQFLSNALGDLREETAEVMHRLKPAKPCDSVKRAREQLCAGCKNEDFCWKKCGEKTEAAFRQLLHYPNANPGPEAMASCIRRSRMAECFRECSQRAALEQSSAVHLSQSRSILMQYFRLMEEMATDAAKQRELQLCSQETEGLRQILRQCRCEFQSCFVHRLKSGRYAAEIYTKTELPASFHEILSDMLHTEMQESAVFRSGSILRCCFCQKPPFRLEYAVRSIHAPGYARCGDSAEAFTDAEGHRYLVLSDGMGSGNTASLMSRLAVRSFVRLVGSGMPPETAIRFANAVLMSESNTESFATLDVLRLNADSGELQLYKSGAASTLLLHHGQVLRIAAQSFPLGIVPQAEPFCKSVAAFADDRIIMLSDGIHEAEYPFMKELLLRNMPLSEVTAQICEKAGIFHAGTADDDITVITAEICCSMSNAAGIRMAEPAAAS